MPKYIKGDSVANATSYVLYEKVGTDIIGYNTLDTNDTINFNLDELSFPVGDHIMVVQAKAEGYEDSDYSNEACIRVSEPTYQDTYFDAGGFINATLGMTSGAVSSGNTKRIIQQDMQYADKEIKYGTPNSLYKWHIIYYEEDGTFINVQHVSDGNCASQSIPIGSYYRVHIQLKDETNAAAVADIQTFVNAVPIVVTIPNIEII